MVGIATLFAGLLMAGSQLSRHSGEPAATSESYRTTAVSEIPTTSITFTTVASATDRLAQQEPPSTPALTSPAMPPIEVPLNWDSQPVKFKVLAVNSLQSGLAVVDLAERIMRVYPLGHHNIGFGSVSVAAFTPRGDILLHPFGERNTYFVPDGDFAATPSAISPSRRAITNAYGDYDDYVDIEALSDRSGGKVWLLQRTRSGTTLVDLVAIEDNTVVSTVEFDGAYFISGLSEDDLYVASGDEDRGDRVVSPGGIVREVGSCDDFSDRYGGLRTVGVYGKHFACLTLNDDKHLVFYSETTGRVDVITAFESGRWSKAVLPEIPETNTTGYHSEHVLLSLRVPDATMPGYDMPKAVYAANLSEHTVRLVHEFEEGRSGTPLGIVDGLLIVATGFKGERWIAAVNIASGEWHRIVDLPEGYFVYDAK